MNWPEVALIVAFLLWTAVMFRDKWPWE